MTIHLLVTLTALFLEDDNLITFQMVQDLSLYFDGADRAANSNITVVNGHQYLVKLYTISCITGQAVNIYFIIFANSELLAGDSNYCKHAPKILRKIKSLFPNDKIK